VVALRYFKLNGHSIGIFLKVVLFIYLLLVETTASGCLMLLEIEWPLNAMKVF
jgi:hypothetical protein